MVLTPWDSDRTLLHRSGRSHTRDSDLSNDLCVELALTPWTDRLPIFIDRGPIIRMMESIASLLRVFTVSVDIRQHVFDDIDVALAYLRGELANNGAVNASIESGIMSRKQYLAAIEREEGAVYGR